MAKKEKSVSVLKRKVKKKGKAKKRPNKKQSVKKYKGQGK
jgi:hypothetical protein